MAGIAQQERNQQIQGTWAYSDAFDHIIVKVGEHWHGFPRGYLVSKKQIHGFQTGDWIRADVHAGQKAGVHIGRYAVRATGSFDTQAGSGLKQGISHRYCRLIQRALGYAYHHTPKIATLRKEAARAGAS